MGVTTVLLASGWGMVVQADSIHGVPKAAATVGRLLRERQREKKWGDLITNEINETQELSPRCRSHESSYAGDDEDERIHECGYARRRPPQMVGTSCPWLSSSAL